MADIFTDETEDLTESTVFSDSGQELESASEPVTDSSDQATVPVQSEQDSVVDETGNSGNVFSDAVPETGEGMETVPVADTVEQIDYTELLQQQNNYLESLVMETRETNERLSDLNHAMPIVSVMFGFVAGVLLVQIFSSYLRV